MLAFLNAPERSPSVFTQLDSADENVLEEEKQAIIAEFEKPVSISLGKYYPTAKQERPSSTVCVKSMAFSGWNPPPGNRRLQGDLFYLEITTPETKQLFITASVSGFFVNQSTRTVFNPAPEKNAKKVCQNQILPFVAHRLRSSITLWTCCAPPVRRLPRASLRCWSTSLALRIRSSFCPCPRL